MIRRSPWVMRPWLCSGTSTARPSTSKPASTAARLHARRGTERERSHVYADRAAHRRRLRAPDPTSGDLAARRAAAQRRRARPSPSPGSPRSRRTPGRSSSGPKPAYGDDWWYAGLLAFIRQEQGRFDEAMALSRRSMADRACSGSLRPCPYPRALRDRRPSSRLRLVVGLDPRRRQHCRQPRALLVACRVARTVDGRLRFRPSSVCRRTRTADGRRMSRVGRLVFPALAVGDHAGLRRRPGRRTTSRSHSSRICSTHRRRLSWRLHSAVTLCAHRVRATRLERLADWSAAARRPGLPRGRGPAWHQR